MSRGFYYFAATQAGDFWELNLGHVFDIKGEEWVCTGFDGDSGVWLARANRMVLMRGKDLWDVLSVRNMSTQARDNWNAQAKKGPSTDYESAWHPTLPVQAPLTFELDGCTVTLYGPGNVHRWRLGTLRAGLAEQAEAYAKLFTASPEMFTALVEAFATLTAEDACDLDPVVGSDNPHEHAAGLVKAALEKAGWQP